MVIIVPLFLLNAFPCLEMASATRDFCLHLKSVYAIAPVGDVHPALPQPQLDSPLVHHIHNQFSHAVRMRAEELIALAMKGGYPSVVDFVQGSLMDYFLVPTADRQYRSTSPFGYVTVWAHRDPSLLTVEVKCTFCGSPHCEHSLLALCRCLVLYPEYFQNKGVPSVAMEAELSSESEKEDVREEAVVHGPSGDTRVVFPYSAEVIRQLAQEEARHWRTSILDPRLHTAPPLDSYPDIIAPQHTSCIFRGCSEELGPPLCVNQNAKIIGGLLGMREGVLFSNTGGSPQLISAFCCSCRCVCSDQAVPEGPH